MEDAGKVLDASLFYPRIKHSYVASICGRACDTACYIHLEEQGKLTRSFHKNFRIRPEWKLED
jgi:NifB/MoaA-like Fe-S oxidoreductase